MNSPSMDIKDILEAAGLGLTFGTNLFIGQEPTIPDNCVTIFDAPGIPPQLCLDRDDAYYYPSIQIRVRNRSYLTGYELVNDIKTELHGVGHETWNGTYYSVIKCAQEPFLLDYDDNNRPRFVANFDLQRR